MDDVGVGVSMDLDAGVVPRSRLACRGGGARRARTRFGTGRGGGASWSRMSPMAQLLGLLLIISHTANQSTLLLMVSAANDPTPSPTERRKNYVCVCCVDSRIYASSYGCTSKAESCTYCCDDYDDEKQIAISSSKCASLGAAAKDDDGNSYHYLCETVDLFRIDHPWSPQGIEPSADSGDEDWAKFDPSKHNSVAPGLCNSALSLRSLTWLATGTAVVVCVVSQLLLGQVL